MIMQLFIFFVSQVQLENKASFGNEPLKFQSNTQSHGKAWWQRFSNLCRLGVSLRIGRWWEMPTLHFES
jgi:hypothetical protein